MPFPLPESNPEALGLDPRPLDRLCALIERHVAESRHPGAQVAVVRRGKLALFRSFGRARVGPDAAPADARSLFLLYSNTKVVTTAALWMLAEDGLLRFNDPVAKHVPGPGRDRRAGQFLEPLAATRAEAMVFIGVTNVIQVQAVQVIARNQP